MRISPLTLLLVILLIATLGFTSVRRTQGVSNKQTPQREQIKKDHFPTAEYEEPDLADARKNRLRKEKQKRHNNFKIVSSSPAEWQAERVFIGEGAFNFPALPVERSAYILIGKVADAQAHVSENKKNVYSEFTVSVERVLKTAKSSIMEGSEITVDRIGGHVKYPDGRSVLYRIAQTNMPAIDGRYVFFITSINNEDYTLVTAYGIEAQGVVPLDDSPQFEEMRGLSEEAFLRNLQEFLAKSSAN